MFIQLFDVQDGVITITPHCLTLKSLRAVKENFPDNYLRVYLYIFYTTCSDPAMNPFFNMPEGEKEEAIIHELQVNFSLDDPIIAQAIDTCNKLYDTPKKRAYEGMKAMMNNLAVFMRTNRLSTGRDGSLTPMISAGKEYHKLLESYNGIEKEYQEEIAVTRGKSYVAYDQE